MGNNIIGSFISKTKCLLSNIEMSETGSQSVIIEFGGIPI